MLRLTQERLRKGMSKAKLARKAQIDQGSQSKIEAGLMRPYPTQLKRIARALGLPTREAELLLEEVPE